MPQGGQGCIKVWTGPRDVPARSRQGHASLPGKQEPPGALGAAASRDVSRSGEIDAAVQGGFRWPAGLPGGQEEATIGGYSFSFVSLAIPASCTTHMGAPPYPLHTPSIPPPCPHA